MRKIGYIGNYYKIPEYIIHSPFSLEYVIVEEGRLTDDMLTFLKVRDVPFCELAEKDELVSKINGMDVDFWITCSYGKRIPMERMPNAVIYNIHYSALPLYKGRHPTYYATVNDEKSMGVSLHRVTEKIDEGDIIAQQFVPYYLWEDENTLFDKLTDKVPILLDSLYNYIQGKNTEIIKNSEGNSFRPVLPEDYTIDLEEDSPAMIYNKVRAQAKYRGALLEYKGEQYWISKVYFSKNCYPGQLCIKKDNYYIVFCARSRWD